MIKRILTVGGALLLVALAALVWRLDIPNWKRLDVEKITGLPMTTVVYDINGAPAGALQGGEKRVWASLSDVPEDVKNAFIAAEDLRFYRHHGVDLYRMAGALWHDLRTMSYSQGGSTITQQLIKLTHLSQTKTLSRKAQEIALALQLERVMDKDQILEAYLNAVYFGHGAYGIEAAANIYFDKSVSGLTLAEGALLAGVIKSPSNYAPHLNPDRAVSRRNAILDTMLENGMITEAARDAAKGERLRLADAGDDDERYAWYMDAVLDEAAEALGLTADEVISGGYAIYSGLDGGMQESAEALFSREEYFPEAAPDGERPQAALSVLDAATGELRAVIGGRSYDVRRGLNRATQALRQPGSAFKPVSTYAAAIDAYGYLPTSVVDDTPRTFPGDYAPRNAGGNSYGQVTLRQALSRSLNIATVALADSIGTSALRTYAQRFGLELVPQDANLSLALGSLTYGVSPAGLGAAYCALANGGGRVSAHVIRRIEDADGNIVYQAQREAERAVSPETAYMLTDMLKTAATAGSARALAECAVPVAGKTGTVAEPDGGTRDIWTVAYTPEIVVTAWMGFDDPGEHSLSASQGGGGYPARLCAAYLNAISGSLGGGDFPRPSGIRQALIDAEALENENAALLSTELTPAGRTALELFHEYDMPVAFSENWLPPAAVDDLRLLTGPGETPVLAFTAKDAAAEYVLTRATDEGSAQIAVLRGAPGEQLRFADADCDLSRPAEYTVLPRNALLREQGTLCAGAPSAAARYVPGGLLNRIMGVGAAEATPAPVEAEPESESQSLFG